VLEVSDSDADLVMHAQAGNVDAIGVLYDRHYEYIFRYIRTRIRDHKLAEDMTADVFTRMVDKLPDYQVTGVPFRAWLYRIAYHLIVDHYRKGGEWMTLPIDQVEDVIPAQQNPVSVVEERLAMEQVQKAITLIDPAQQEVVVLRFLVGLPLQEVAASLDKSVAAVKSLQHRGLKALRVALKQV
jgi:RNA polymerase sigma factor (sigma-70 family)